MFSAGADGLATKCKSLCHPEGNPGANFKSISHRCYLREVEFEWELTNKKIYLPLGCLQGGTRVVGTYTRLVGLPQEEEGGVPTLALWAVSRVG